jgi:hypothetical protein
VGVIIARAVILHVGGGCDYSLCVVGKADSEQLIHPGGSIPILSLTAP